MFKRFLIFTGIFLVILASNLVLLKLFLEPNRWRQDIEVWLSTKTEAKVKLGEFKLSTLPGIKLTIDGVDISDTAKTYFHTEKVEMRLSARSLLRLKPSWAVTIKNPNVDLFVDQSNKIDLINIFSGKVLTQPQTKTKERGMKQAILAASTFDVYIEKADTKIKHETSESLFHFKNLDLTLRKLSLKDSMTFKLQTQLDSMNFIDTTLGGTIKADGKFSIRNIQNRSWEADTTLDLSRLALSYQKNVFHKTDVEILKFHVRAIYDQVFSVQADGQFKGLSFSGSYTKENLKLKTQEFSLAEIKSNFSIFDKYQPQGTIKLETLFKGPTLSSRYLQFSSAGLSFEVPSKISNIQLKGSVFVKGEGSAFLEADVLQRFHQKALIDFTKSNIIAEKDKKFFFIKPQEKLFSIHSEAQYEIGKGFSIIQLEGDLSDFHFKLEKPGSYNNFEEADVSLILSAARIDDLKFFIQPMSQFGLESGNIFPTSVSLKNGKISGFLKFKNVVGAIERMPLAFEGFKKEGVLEASGQLNYVWNRSELESLQGDVAIDLRQAQIGYSKFFEKKQKNPLYLKLQINYQSPVWATKFNIEWPAFHINGEGTASKEKLDIHLKTSIIDLVHLNEVVPKIHQFPLRYGKIEADAHLTGKPSEPSVDVSLNFEEVGLEFNEKKNISTDFSLLGKAQLEGNFSALWSKQNFQIKNLKLRSDLTQMDMRYKEQFQKNKGESASLVLNASRDGSKTKIEDSKISILGTDIHISGEATDIKKQIMNVEVKTKIKNLRNFHQHVALLRKFDMSGELDFVGKFSKKQAQTSMQTDHQFKLMNASMKVPGIKPTLSDVSGEVRLKNADLKIDKISLKAGSTLANLDGSISFKEPRAHLTVKSSFFDFDQLFEKKETGSQGFLWELQTDPKWKNADLSGNVEVSSGRYSQYDFNNFKAAVFLKNKVFRLSNLDFKMYGGSVAAKTSVNFTTEIPTYTFEGAISDLDLKSFLTVKSEKLAQEIEGKFSTHCVIQGQGLSWEFFRNNASGSGRLVVTDGKFEHLNMMQTVLERLRVFGARIPPDLNLSGKYDLLKGNFEMARGKVSSSNIRLDAPDYYILLDGDFYLDTRLDLKGKYLFKKQGYGFPIYVDLSGTLRQPQIQPDVQEYIRSVITGVITDIFK
ncbi:MAG: AsmA-like C-terminal region-containing protein [Deltaproteobacteria bacterium]|nr:AsmA-like C-terminal region-containing protein [Deltaproteobacteria bacterium]